MLKNLILVAVDHVVSDHGREKANATMALDGKDATLNVDKILLSEHLFGFGHLARDNVSVEALANVLHNAIASLANLTTNALTLQARGKTEVRETKDKEWAGQVREEGRVRTLIDSTL